MIGCRGRYQVGSEVVDPIDHDQGIQRRADAVVMDVERATRVVPGLLARHGYFHEIVPQRGVVRGYVQVQGAQVREGNRLVASIQHHQVEMIGSSLNTAPSAKSSPIAGAPDRRYLGGEFIDRRDPREKLRVQPAAGAAVCRWIGE